MPSLTAAHDQNSVWCRTMEHKIRDLLNKYHVPGRCGCLLDKSPESIKDMELAESTIAAFLYDRGFSKGVGCSCQAGRRHCSNSEYGFLTRPCARRWSAPPATASIAIFATDPHRPTRTGTDQRGHFVCGCLCGSVAIFLNKILYELVHVRHRTFISLK